VRVLVIGAGGVGSAVAGTIATWNLFERVVVADYDLAKAQRAVAGKGERFAAYRLNASDEVALLQLIDAEKITAVLNVLDPRFVMNIFTACLKAGVTYLDTAMSLSTPHPEHPTTMSGLKLGDEQFALEERWRERGQLALCGIGIEPGMSDVFARYAADDLFSSIDEIGVRDGSNMSIRGYDFAPTFSIWTTIEECLNPPVIYERERGWFTTEPFSEPEIFHFPGGIGDVECVNVEHEEVLLIPRWIDVGRVTFKFGLDEQFLNVLRTLHTLGLDSVKEVNVNGKLVAPRDLVAACLPDPAQLGERIDGSTCAGTWVKGTGTDGSPREVYLYHVVDNAWSMKEFGAQAVVWQTALNPVVALELLDSGAWSGTGVLGPEALPATPFLDLVNAHGCHWGLEER
jgi:saccharopine dehydrogenase-like NADP-dependent oxidoreductase